MAEKQSIFDKLHILADSAKYDVSCATSGVERKNVGRMGNASCAGICHSWSADGRCISLLKVLQSNRCALDCQYCVNRRTATTERASFEPAELASLTMEFYRRNYIEGLFLSSAVEGSPDRTSERMLACLGLLRREHGFAGYIHAKIIPGTSPELVHALGLLADRISVNIELPSAESLDRLAPQKHSGGILGSMKQIGDTIAERRMIGTSSRRPAEPFAPAGQSTQMIIGASPENDRQILAASDHLYRSFAMKRVYFSAYIPINETPDLPALLTPPPLLREHRLYQADWLMRFYHFEAKEILDSESPWLDLDFDPKCAWALRHIELFPMEINRVSMEELLRVPGIGTVSARRIVRQRRQAAVRFDDLKKIGVVVKRAKHFITCCGRYYGDGKTEPRALRARLLDQDAIRRELKPAELTEQLSMFASPAAPLVPTEARR